VAEPGGFDAKRTLRIVGQRASRGRWIRKAQLVRRYGATVPGELRYLLTDPELDTFSYELANADDLAKAVADAAGVPVTTVSGLFAEVRGDKVLADRIRRATRWHPEAKRRPPLGRQLARYAMTRLLRPELIVECGIKHGLGAAVMLRALERNAEDGAQPGQLIGIDPDPRAGWLVSPRTTGWERVVARSTDALPGVLRGRPTGLLVHDSVPDVAVARYEYEAALACAAPALALIGNGNWTSALRDLGAERGFACYSVAERPAGHFYPGAVQDLAIVHAPDSARDA
jgi:hypothetical protein